jgi:hypothetical protein
VLTDNGWFKIRQHPDINVAVFIRESYWLHFAII